MRLFGEEVPSGKIPDGEKKRLQRARDERWTAIRNLFEKVDPAFWREMKKDADETVSDGAPLEVFSAAVFISTVIDEVRYRKHKQLIEHI